MHSGEEMQYIVDVKTQGSLLMYFWEIIYWKQYST